VNGWEGSSPTAGWFSDEGKANDNGLIRALSGRSALMKATDLVDRLAEHKTLGAAPREELAWLASHGYLRQMNPGDVLTAKGATVAGLFVVLSGRITISVDRGAGPRKIMEWQGGDVTGLLPYSRMVSPPGDTVAQEPTEILHVPRDCLRELTRECYEITPILAHSMVDRARLFNASALQDEKMISLGKLSAGLTKRIRQLGRDSPRRGWFCKTRDSPHRGGPKPGRPSLTSTFRCITRFLHGI